MSAMPTFTFTAGGSDVWQTVIEDVFSVMLWGNDEEFDAFATWAANDSNEPSVNQFENGTGYSGYVLSLKCTITSSTATDKDGTGCCLRDNDVLEGGGYCIVYEHATVSANTYLLTDEQFYTAEQTDNVITSTLQIDTSTSNETGFEVFQCTVVGDVMTCHKF